MTVRGRHYDWPTLKAAYVEGIPAADGAGITYPSFDDLAKAHDVVGTRLRERAAEEGWTDQRAMFQRRVELERRDQRATELARLGADLDLSALRISRAGLALTASRLNEITDAHRRRLEGRADTNRTDPLPLPVDGKEVAALALAGQRWFEMGTRALGDTQTSQFHADALYLSAPQEVDVSIEMRDVHIRGIVLALVEAGELPIEVAHSLGVDPDDERQRAAARVLEAVGGEDAGRGDDDAAGGVDDPEDDPVHSA